MVGCPAVLEVDVLTFALRAGDLHVLLVKRTQPPLAEAWALPGARLGPGRAPRQGGQAKPAALFRRPRSDAPSIPTEDRS